MSITVKISGPGETFDLELYYIQKVLEEMGWEVEVKNEYSNKIADSVDPDAEFDRIKKLRIHRGFNNATIIADHCPWGG